MTAALPSIREQPLTVVVVDDEPQNLELLERILRRRYRVLGATSGERALELLSSTQDVAAIITDQRMHGVSGVELLRRSIDLAPDAIRIIVSGYTDTKDILDAINLGQVDRFILKPIEADRFVNTVKEALEIYYLTKERSFLVQELSDKNRRLLRHEAELEKLVNERTAELTVANRDLQAANAELERLNRKLSDMALRDGLTGLYNHRYFHERLGAEIARARRHDHPLTLLFLDIDKFKAFNDTYGHPAGDELLRSVARLLTADARVGDVVARVRETDVVARYGGEEFAIILPETDLRGGQGKAERIRENIASYDFVLSPVGPAVSVTVSIGLASFPEIADGASELIHAADQAMYQAKRSGRNRVCLASPER